MHMTAAIAGLGLSETLPKCGRTCAWTVHQCCQACQLQLQLPYCAALDNAIHNVCYLSGSNCLLGPNTLHDAFGGMHCSLSRRLPLPAVTDVLAIFTYMTARAESYRDNTQQVSILQPDPCSETEEVQKQALNLALLALPAVLSAVALHHPASAAVLSAVPAEIVMPALQAAEHAEPAELPEPA